MTSSFLRNSRVPQDIMKTLQIILFQTYLIGWVHFKIYIICHLSRLQKAFLIKKFTIIYLLKSILVYCISNLINQIKKKYRQNLGQAGHHLKQ